MAMNRQTKRMLQRQGEVGSDGAPVARKRSAPKTPRPDSERTGPVQFAREVRGELRKVVWPTREDLIRYSVIVLAALIVMTAYIAGADWVFSEAVSQFFRR